MRRCPKCGLEYVDDSKICRACGAILDDVDALAETTPFEPAATTSPWLPDDEELPPAEPKDDPWLPEDDEIPLPAPAAGDWICTTCGEHVPATFDVCWNCATAESPLAAALTLGVAPVQSPVVAQPQYPRRQCAACRFDAHHSRRGHRRHGPVLPGHARRDRRRRPPCPHLQKPPPRRTPRRHLRRLRPRRAPRPEPRRAVQPLSKLVRSDSRGQPHVLSSHHHPLGLRLARRRDGDVRGVGNRCRARRCRVLDSDPKQEAGDVRRGDCHPPHLERRLVRSGRSIPLAMASCTRNEPAGALHEQPHTHLNGTSTIRGQSGRVPCCLRSDRRRGSRSILASALASAIGSAMALRSIP